MAIRPIAWLTALVAAWSFACSPPRAPVLGTRELAIEDQDIERTYLLHEPRPSPARPRPLLIVLHGGASSGAEMEWVTGFSRIADREGFVVAYPDALGMPVDAGFRVWNTRECCSRGHLLGIDDVELVKHLVRHLRDELPIDGRRIYLVGYSNGGALAYRVAIEDALTFAALGIYAALPPARGALGAPEMLLSPLEPVGLIAIHSEDDRRVPYAGSGGGDSLNPPFLFSGHYWAERLRCAAWAPRESGGAFFVERATGCAGGTDVELVTLTGWSHEWPGPANYRELGAPPGLASFDAAERMWAFFKAHRKGG